jgi:hypothetical protein
MGRRHNEAKIKESLKNRSLGNKIAQITNLFGNAANKKTDMLSIWNYIWAFALFFFCFATSGYAMDVTLQWTPENAPNLANPTNTPIHIGKPLIPHVPFMIWIERKRIIL